MSSTYIEFTSEKQVFGNHGRMIMNQTFHDLVKVEKVFNICLGVSLHDRISQPLPPKGAHGLTLH